jgi:hypothetical protein
VCSDLLHALPTLNRRSGEERNYNGPPRAGSGANQVNGNTDDEKEIVGTYTGAEGRRYSNIAAKIRQVYENIPAKQLQECHFEPASSAAHFWHRHGRAIGVNRPMKSQMATMINVNAAGFVKF